jgi:geranylgeranyl reductase family protein
MQNFDVGIVGGGPVGGFIAGNIAKKGFNVAVLEKNKEIGKLLNCAGLITPRVFDLIDINKKNVVQNEILGANIHSPSDDILSIGGDRIHALAIDRQKFDKEIIKKSKKNGAEIFLDNNVLSVHRLTNKVELRTSKKTDFRFNLLIGADGPFSKTRDRFTFPKPSEFLQGIGAEIINTDLNPGFVEIFIGNNIAPGFFAWVIPINQSGTEARIGLCIGKNAPYPPKYYFEKFLRHKNTLKIFDNIKVIRYIGGVIPLGVIKKTYDSNIMLVGDAAAQVKPTSGGGIYTGLLCAKYCSKIAIESLTKRDYSSIFLKRYHRLWRSDIGRELNMGMKFRRIFKNLSDRQFDRYINKLKNPDIVDIISKYGDIDYPSKLLRPLITKAPTLLGALPNIIRK